MTGGVRVLALALLAIAWSAPLSAATMADFSDIDTPAKARALVRAGRLVMVLLFPAELGGQNVRENRVYITPEAAARRSLIIGTLQRYAREGLADRMDVPADYKGDSIIPSRIRMEAWREGTQGSLEPALQIW